MSCNVKKRASHLRKALLAAVVLLPLHALWGDEEAVATNRPLSFAEVTGIQGKVLALLERAAPATVKVGGGSGVIVDEEGHVLTVAHVGRRANRPIRITLADGTELRGKTLGNNDKVDAGVAKVTGRDDWTHTPMGDSDRLKVGDWCVALGYPVSYKAGEPAAVRVGRVLAIRPHAIITDCTIMGGDSGGPLFNLDGEVVGIATRASGPPALNLYVPINEFTEAWDKFLAGTDWHGCRHDEEEQPAHAYLGIGPTDNVRSAEIGRVFEDSPADKAGLRTGDTVTAVDGADVASYTEILPLMLRREPGDEVEIAVRRDDATVVLKATLGEVEE